MRLPLMLRLLYGASLLLGEIIALGYLRYGLSTNLHMGNGKRLPLPQKKEKKKKGSRQIGTTLIHSDEHVMKLWK